LSNADHELEAADEKFQMGQSGNEATKSLVKKPRSFGDVSFTRMERHEGKYSK
jgi:hypothetical protein